jgi:RNA polymerase primary sigma factor
VRQPISLETPIGEDDGNSELGDLIANGRTPSPEEQASKGALRDQLENVLESLPERERRIIKLRFGLYDDRSHTLEEIGNEFGLSRERVRQIEREAFKKLRQPELSQHLKDYLG